MPKGGVPSDAEFGRRGTGQKKKKNEHSKN